MKNRQILNTNVRVNYYVNKFHLFTAFVLIVFLITNFQYCYSCNEGGSVFISGNVNYEDSTNVIAGYVKAMIYIDSTDNIIVIDSVNVEADGSYIFQNISGSVPLFIMAYPNTELDFAPAYYPNTPSWQSAIRVDTDSNHVNINIFVPRIQNSANSGHIYGIVNTEQFLELSGIKDAIIYAKINGVYKNFSVSSGTGMYDITSLFIGSYALYVDRIGYNPQTVNVSMNSDSFNVNFQLHRILIGINNNQTRIPEQFELKQNYPNPFNPGTVVEFHLKSRTYITLKVYDIAGAEVAKIFDGYKNAGSYRFNYDASELSSGVYYYELSDGQTKQTRKMVVLK